MASIDSKHTFSFFPPTSGLFLGGGPRGIRKHRGTVDADVIKVRLLQEVLLALGKHTPSEDLRNMQKLKLNQLSKSER